MRKIALEISRDYFQVPSGLFIPSLLLGAAWGRLIGIGINKSCESCDWTTNMSKYALIGAAAQLGESSSLLRVSALTTSSRVENKRAASPAQCWSQHFLQEQNHMGSVLCVVTVATVNRTGHLASHSSILPGASTFRKV